MAHPTTPLEQLVARLRKADGAPPTLEKRTAFEWVIWENVAYLVDDDTRAAVFAALEKRVGLTPKELLATSVEKLVPVIRDGGMQPSRRAEKLHRAATIAEGIGLEVLDEAVRSAPERARSMLKKFPGIGEPGADKILLFVGRHASLAPDSNVLRVLVRLGFGREEKDYSRMYRLTTEAAERDVAEGARWIVAAHQILRRHGQIRCKRSKPLCETCPLTADCAYRSGNHRMAAM